ncbi:hypothetical protein Aspvir_009164 [Aspergillus viridinutans]|uniref:Nucleoside phosphorylase domain-containing protein n=1 Tax=Aspergillus viridinutans TaxID=75553 RepID=A0A9P3F860_ASPVI|nr:uncharacterized protein Aspvir_009164 [Aspergillus viridinutans]GIK05065.1 hypothetical protein Aspvir_009164 [Aspergillus viridinutans]
MRPRLEAAAVAALFDESFGVAKHGKMLGDGNSYSMGVLGRYNVVLAHMPSVGKVAAATTAAGVRSSFPNIELVIVVGICGAVLQGRNGQDINLGDVIISKGLIQYDMRRRLLGNRILRKDSVYINLPLPRAQIRGTLATLQTLHIDHALSRKYGNMRRPSGKNWVMRQNTQGQRGTSCLTLHININTANTPPVGYVEPGKTTLEYCKEQEVVHRASSSKPVIHFGLIGSGNTVMRSGEDRASIVGRDQVIAFEMEVAGVWETFSSVLVIKGASYYADGHKSKRW